MVGPPNWRSAAELEIAKGEVEQKGVDEELAETKKSIRRSTLIICNFFHWSKMNAEIYAVKDAWVL